MLVLPVPYAGDLCLPWKGNLPVFPGLAAVVCDGDFACDMPIPGEVDPGGYLVPWGLVLVLGCLYGYGWGTGQGGA